MRRHSVLPVVAGCLLLASCAMWTPTDPNWTPAEREAHAAQVAKDEASVRAGGQFVQSLLPPPFGAIAALLTTAALGGAAVVRNRKR